jgi:hypothetical protein
MSLKEQIKEANKQGKVFVLKDPSDMVMTLPDGRTVMEIFTPGKYEDTNMLTSRYIGVSRSEPAKLLKPLKYVVRDGPKGGITRQGTLKAGEVVRIFGWPGFANKDHCDLIVLGGDAELPNSEDARDELRRRVIECKEGTYINLVEGVDYEYTGQAPMVATKTREEVITARDIDYTDQYFCNGTIPAMTTLLLCTQFGETFLEFEGNEVLTNPVEGEDYI